MEYVPESFIRVSTEWSRAMLGLAGGKECVFVIVNRREGRKKRE